MVKEFIVENVTRFFAGISKIEESEDKYSILKYGVEIIYSTVTKSILLIAVALYLGILLEVAVFAAGYCLLRIFSFGIHLKSNVLCTLLGFIYYLGGVYLAKVTTIPLYALLIIFIVIFLVYLKYAPAGTKSRPIGKKEKRPLKIKSLACLVIVYIISITLGGGIYRNLLIYASIAQAVNILPVTYLIFREGRITDYEKND